MHEYAIAAALVGIAEDNAGGRRVTAIDLRVGRLRQVVPTALEFAFEVASKETSAEGAELRLTVVAPVVACGACGAETETSEFPLICGSCRGFDISVVAGEELDVESIEVLSDEQEEVV